MAWQPAGTYTTSGSGAGAGARAMTPEHTAVISELEDLELWVSGTLALNFHIQALDAEPVARLHLFMEAPEAILLDLSALRHLAYLHRDNTTTTRVKSLVMLHIRARPFKLASIAELK
ncbi:hypothetical protein E5D57_010104 [Metarhizium anisopliae]|nr:hypothetical protein E5D57_010104 [Metarhizium anisopliae]